MMSILQSIKSMVLDPVYFPSPRLLGGRIQSTRLDSFLVFATLLSQTVLELVLSLYQENVYPLGPMVHIATKYKSFIAKQIP